MNTIDQDLAALGTTAYEIAQSLIDLGIKGKVGKSDSCPIFNYLQSKGHRLCSVEDPDYQDYMITRDPCQVYYMVEGFQRLYNTSDPLSTFIREFDNGKYPTLEDK